MEYAVDFKGAKCDKYDYLAAVCSGVLAGIIDVFLVGVPGNSILGNIADEQADKLVMKFAKMTDWDPRAGNEKNVASAIGYLEKKFKVNYDLKNTTEVGKAFKMGPTNHHYKSLGHSPDVVGLFFSVLDQFQGKASFLSDGQLIRIDTSGQDFVLRGSNVVSKIFCGFANWLGHIMSDMAGSSGGRGSLSGRGSGVSLPFMELFQLCDFGQLQVGKNRQTLATVMTEVFQSGYDLRHGAAMAVPVIINELVIRLFWMIRARFFRKREWRDCIPSAKHSDLRVMLLVGTACLCTIDGVDAFIKSGGNPVAFLLHMNYVAWMRLIMLALKELWIRYGDQVKELLKKFLDELDNVMTPAERRRLEEYYQRIEQMKAESNRVFNEYASLLDEEYRQFRFFLEQMEDEGNSLEIQALNSEKLAEISGVAEEKIIRSDEDLDHFFLD